MSKAIDNITSHFRSKVSGDLKEIDVPEWNMKVYFKSTQTLQEQTKVIELAQKGQTVEALVETLIMKARDKDGNKLFKPVEKTVLMNEADPDVVIRVVGAMNNVDLESIGEVEKN